MLATQTLQQGKPRAMRIRYEGELGYGVGAKDLILGTIGRIGAGAAGHVIEYAGGPIERLSMEGRMTVCNMTIEAGGRAGMIAPDETTSSGSRPACRARPVAGRRVERSSSDRDARFDREVTIDAGAALPAGDLGYHPGDGRGRDRRRARACDEGDRRALDYMALEPGTPMREIRLDRVFVGSCTNSRIGDLREAAEVVQGRRVASGVAAMVVPGSQQVKAQAEAEGLDEVFRAAGFDWRSAGCSMCLGMNPDILKPGERCASTSNRNFEGRQGRGGRTHLVSPRMAAAAAIEGRLVDVRSNEGGRPDRGRVTVLDRSDVDTDQIIPKQFLKRVERSGFGEFLFHDWAKEPGCCRATRSSPRDATSAAAPRASTRRGRSRTTASRRSSRRASPTSSTRTARRSGCCRWRCPRRRAHMEARHAGVDLAAERVTWSGRGALRDRPR